MFLVVYRNTRAPKPPHSHKHSKFPHWFTYTVKHFLIHTWRSQRWSGWPWELSAFFTKTPPEELLPSIRFVSFYFSDFIGVCRSPVQQLYMCVLFYLSCFCSANKVLIRFTAVYLKWNDKKLNRPGSDVWLHPAEIRSLSIGFWNAADIRNELNRQVSEDQPRHAVDLNSYQNSTFCTYLLSCQHLRPSAEDWQGFCLLFLILQTNVFDSLLVGDMFWPLSRGGFKRSSGTGSLSTCMQLS